MIQFEAQEQWMGDISVFCC